MNTTPKETAIKESILHALAKLGPDCWARKIFANAEQGAGIPDILVCYKGRFVALEVKRPGQKATPLQADTICRITEAGGLALVVTSATEALAAIHAPDSAVCDHATAAAQRRETR